MDVVEEIVKVITNVGFPIAMCIYMLFENKKNTEKLTDAVNNNTIIMQKILTKLDMDDDDKK